MSEYRETPDTSRVYVSEWLVVHASADEADCLTAFQVRYAERVRDEEWRVCEVEPGRWQLQLLLPNLKAEFKTAELAAAFVSGTGLTGATVVTRNSRAEFLLRDYGVKKLIST